MASIQYNDIIENEFILSKDGLKWIEFNSFINNIKLKYKNILDDFKWIDGFAFPSDSYVTRFPDLTNKTKLLQISNVNDFEWITSENQKFEYVPNKYLLSKKKYLLDGECILISLTGGTETNNDITTYFDNSFQAFLNQRISAMKMKEYDKNDFFYFYALTKSSFFKEQWLGKGGIQKNTISSDRNKIYLPKVNDKNIIKYVSVLTQSIINKQKRIETHHKLISKLIEEELGNNQFINKFEFELPKFQELEYSTRLDTGTYSKQFKQIDFLIRNYSNGFSFIDENKFKSGNTPKTRYINSDPKLNYRWVTPTNCSDIGYISFDERINLKGTNNINEDCILLINRTSKGGLGEYVGIANYYDYKDLGKGHHNQGLYKVYNYPKEYLLFILCFLNSEIIRKYCAGLSVGSKMKELKSEHFLQIPIPNFSTKKQNEIVQLFHKQFVSYNPQDWNLDIFLTKDDEFNKIAGIYELDKTIKQLKAKLDIAIDDIVNDRPVKTEL
jgi:hypothetical protein